MLELANHDKINLDNIIMVGVNCGGTFPPVPTRNMIEEIFEVDADQVINEEIERGKFIIKIEDGSKKEININKLEKGIYGRRSNCRRCELNIPTSADIGFGNWGVMGDYVNDYSCVEVFTVRGAEILDKAISSGKIFIEETSTEAAEIRHKIDKSMVDLTKKWQLQDFKEELNNDILSIFSHYHDEFQKCIKCFGCRNACPICYCKECTLEINTPEWVDKGQIPPSSLFHVERLIHMVESCTNCGQCEDVCPMDIPLAKIWNQINLMIKELKYFPGMDNQLVLFDYFKRTE
jgi:formate dehydrogenase subunit beta